MANNWRCMRDQCSSGSASLWRCCHHSLLRPPRSRVSSASWRFSRASHLCRAGSYIMAVVVVVEVMAMWKDVLCACVSVVCLREL